MMPTIDLNCDLGEGFPSDAELIPLITSANIACGAHAGDDDSIRQALRLCQAHGVNAGLHPGFADRANFGRVEIAMPATELRSLLRPQFERVAALARIQNVRLTHLKPHGALYHYANRHPAIARELVRVLREFDPALRLVAPPKGELALAAREQGVVLIAEGFADRAYQPDGSLVPRTHPHAVHHNPDLAAKQALELVLQGQVTPLEGAPIPLRIQTLCVHGDGPAALSILRNLRPRLLSHDVHIEPFRLDLSGPA